MQTVARALASLAVALPAAAGAVTTTDLNSLTPESLAQKLVGVGVRVSNVRYTGAPEAGGIFGGGAADGLGIEAGVILSTGNIADASGPNLTDDTTTQHGTPGDSQLSQLVGFPTGDAAVLEFDFVPTSSSFAFSYIFASEEYNEFVGSPFNDVFAFFLDGVNIALVPGTSSPVAVNSVNGSVNSQLFNDNDPGLDDEETPSLPTPFGTGFDGFTTVLTASAQVTPFATHRIKLAIADTSDLELDSAVFLAQGTLSSGGETRLSPVGGSPAVATDLSGNRVVVWSQPPAAAAASSAGEAPQASAGGIFGRLVDEQGFPIGGTFEVSTGAGEGTPAVAFDPSGNFIVAWAQGAAGSSSGPGAQGAPQTAGAGVFGRLFDAQGNSVTEFQADTGGGTDLAAPKVDTNANGDFVLSWRRRQSASQAQMSGSPEDVFARIFNRAGSPTRSPFQVADDAAAGSPPRIATAPDGEFVVVWEQDGGGAIRGRWFDAAGQPRGPAFQVNGPAPGATLAAPSVAIDARGNFAVAWAQAASSSQVFARTFNRGGTPAGSPVRVSPADGRDYIRPAVGINRRGDIAFAWKAVVPAAGGGYSTADGAEGLAAGQGTGNGVFGRLFPGGDLGGDPDELEATEVADESQVGNPEVSVDNQGEVTVVYSKSAGGSDTGVFSRIFAPQSEGACQPSSTVLCLNDNRFSVTANWEDFEGNRGLGQAITLTDDTGYFWFFSPTNLELAVKVLDGRGFNGNFWVFYGALSNVEYSLTVTDTQTGNSKTYFNPSGAFASVGDIEALPGSQAASGSLHTAEVVSPATAPEPWARPGAAPSPLAAGQAGTCAPSDTRLCLRDNRFSVEATWRDFEGNTGVATAVPLTFESGYFWFFDEANVELVVKLLDGRPLTGFFWVFYGAQSNVEYEITVRDTVLGNEKTYRNDLGVFGSLGDIFALPGG